MLSRWTGKWIPSQRLQPGFLRGPHERLGRLSVTDSPQPIWLHFAGYNTRKSCFFVDRCLLEGTNAARIEPVKTFRGASDPNPICLQGEPAFLQALLSGDKPISCAYCPRSSPVRPPHSSPIKVFPMSALPVCILEMFRLHTTYSAQLGYDQGFVGPPYLICKITRDNVVELTRRHRRNRQARRAGGAARSGDEREIDDVMAKLETSFKDNDYAYLFVVMYAPVVERMGGKEQGVLAAQAIVAQMKQQQMVMVSWKAKKPYQYIRGESRTYAVIPYESVLIIAGKRLRQESYQLGIKAAGSNWQFVNGDTLNPELFREFFPDFPSSAKLRGSNACQNKSSIINRE